jgi:metal-responsive CopG/Arc/MetJ family transcriptional regulator
MWQTTKQEQPITEKKLNVTFTIDKNLYEQFKRVAQKDMRKYSNIVEGSIRRYVQSKI